MIHCQVARNNVFWSLPQKVVEFLELTRASDVSRADVPAKEPSLVVCNSKILPFVNYGERSRTLHHQARRTSHMDQSLETEFALQD
jgi:hypothetical protein